MKARVAGWKRTRHCAIWALRNLPQPCTRPPTDVIRIILSYVHEHETIYCWLCMDAFPLDVRKREPPLVFANNDRQPVCSSICHRSTPPATNEAYRKTYAANEPMNMQFVKAYRWLSRLAHTNCPNGAAFGWITWRQVLAYTMVSRLKAESVAKLHNK